MSNAHTEPEAVNDLRFRAVRYACRPAEIRYIGFSPQWRRLQAVALRVRSRRSSICSRAARRPDGMTPGGDMDAARLIRVLLYCAGINYALLILWFVAFLAAKEWLANDRPPLQKPLYFFSESCS